MCKQAVLSMMLDRPARRPTAGLTRVETGIDNPWAEGFC